MEIPELPALFLTQMRALLGDDEYKAYLASFSETPVRALRTNLRKLAPGKLKMLLPYHLSPVSWAPDGFYIEEGPVQTPDCPPPSKHPLYGAGLYYLQEASAMAPVSLFDVRPGDRVLDLCAAPGGKSTALAGKLMDRGLLVSNDLSYSRARALLKNLELTGTPNFCLTSESPERLAAVWPGFFNKILVDAPCSGEGMFRKEPGMRAEWERHGPSFYSCIQRGIMENAVTMLSPGGLLMYSTCTFSIEENEATITYILERFPEMEPVPLKKSLIPGAAEGLGLPGCLRLYPHRVHGEGHFLSLLRKKGESGEDANKPFFKETPSFRMYKKKEYPQLDLFLSALNIHLDENRLRIHEDNVYLLPECFDPSLHLRFLRTGLLAGRLKGARFEPSQALAMYLREGEYPAVLNLPLSDERVMRYLRGETLKALPGEEIGDGWCLVTVQGYSMGWAKGKAGSLKNKIYPGWRFY